jgi:hypothetical protein
MRKVPARDTSFATAVTVSSSQCLCSHQSPWDLGLPKAVSGPKHPKAEALGSCHHSQATTANAGRRRREKRGRGGRARTRGRKALRTEHGPGSGPGEEEPAAAGTSAARLPRGARRVPPGPAQSRPAVDSPLAAGPPGLRTLFTPLATGLRSPVDAGICPGQVTLQILGLGERRSCRHGSGDGGETARRRGQNS